MIYPVLFFIIKNMSVLYLIIIRNHRAINVLLTRTTGSLDPRGFRAIRKRTPRGPPTFRIASTQLKPRANFLTVNIHVYNTTLIVCQRGYEHNIIRVCVVIIVIVVDVAVMVALTTH